MGLQPGVYRMGPEDGTLSVRTGRGGVAAKAGHDLLIHVTRWDATVTVGEATSVELRADATSLRVREGTGGMQALGDDDRADIEQTIDAEVLKRTDIGFRSTSVETAGDRLAVRGELTLMKHTRPVAFELEIAGDRLTGTTELTQSDFGMKPYSTLFGTLKVLDQVTVAVDVTLPTAS